jgi:hypothetical protein
VLERLLRTARVEERVHLLARHEVGEKAVWEKAV